MKMRSQENVQHVQGIYCQVPITWLIPANETKSSENPLKKYLEILFENTTQKDLSIKLWGFWRRYAKST